MIPVPEVLALRIEVCTLKIEKLQLVAQPIADEQAALIEQARVAADAPRGYLYNTLTRQFQPPAAVPGE